MKSSLKKEDGITKITLIIFVFILVVIVFALSKIFSSNKNPEKVENEISGYLNGTYEEITDYDENKTIVKDKVRPNKIKNN